MNNLKRANQIPNSVRNRLLREIDSYDAVIITGASSGIGRAFVEIIDEIGHIKICNISRTFPDDFNTKNSFTHISCNLCDSTALDAACQQAIDFIFDGFDSSKKPLKLLLINNAGFGAYGVFPSPSIDRNCDMIDLNVRALTRICGIFAKTIIEGKGGIINIASTAAFQPCPQLCVYAATKSYVMSFTLGMANEMHSKGVKVLCVCPGPTSSNFFSAAGFDTPPLPSGFGHKASDVAIASLLALAKGKKLKVVGKINTIQTVIVKILPINFVLWVSGKILSKIRGEAK